MYNEEQKRRFISDSQLTEDVRIFAEAMFSSLEKFENAWGADVCTRSEEELQPAINELSGLRSSVRHTRMSVLRRYFAWCKNTGVPGTTDAIFHISPDNTEKIRSHMVSGPLALSLFLDNVFRPLQDHDVSVLFRCFYWLVFSGIRENDVLSVKKQDVDIEAMLIHFNGDDYPIYKEAVVAFRLAKELKMFYYYHSLYNNRTEMPRTDSEFLLSASEGVISMHYVKSYTVKHKRRAADAGRISTSLNFNHTFLSGVFYRKFEFERAVGRPYTFEDFLDVVNFVTKNSTYSEKSFGTPKKIQNMKNRMAKHYLEDYTTWKNVFNV